MLLYKVIHIKDQSKMLYLKCSAYTNFYKVSPDTGNSIDNFESDFFNVTLADGADCVTFLASDFNNFGSCLFIPKITDMSSQT